MDYNEIILIVIAILIADAIRFIVSHSIAIGFFVAVWVGAILGMSRQNDLSD